MKISDGVIFPNHKLRYFHQTRFVCHEDSIVLKCCNLFSIMLLFLDLYGKNTSYANIIYYTFV